MRASLCSLSARRRGFQRGDLYGKHQARVKTTCRQAGAAVSDFVGADRMTASFWPRFRVLQQNPRPSIGFLLRNLAALQESGRVLQHSRPVGIVFEATFAAAGQWRDMRSVPQGERETIRR